jgi:type IV pilus assembly protein PilX
MTTRTHRIAIPQAQKGAALIIGLLLLTVLTLLAITGMNTASTELTMAGNEQFRQNAFEAAETGIEQALVVLPTLAQTAVPVVVGATNVPNSTTDQYSTRTTYMGEDANIPNFSIGKFTGYHYEIVSQGTSARNAQSTHTQGAYVIQKSGGL